MLESEDISQAIKDCIEKVLRQDHVEPFSRESEFQFRLAKELKTIKNAEVIFECGPLTLYVYSNITVEDRVIKALECDSVDIVIIKGGKLYPIEIKYSFNSKKYGTTYKSAIESYLSYVEGFEKIKKTIKEVANGYCVFLTDKKERDRKWWNKDALDKRILQIHDKVNWEFESKQGYAYYLGIITSEHQKD